MTVGRYELKNDILASNELENIVMWSSTVTRHKSSSHSDFRMLIFLNFNLVLRQMCFIGEVLEKYYTRPQSWRVTAMSQVGGARCYRGNVYHTASYCCHDGIVCLLCLPQSGHDSPPTCSSKRFLSWRMLGRNNSWWFVGREVLHSLRDHPNIKWFIVMVCFKGHTVNTLMVIMPLVSRGICVLSAINTLGSKNGWFLQACVSHLVAEMYQ